MRGPVYLGSSRFPSSSCRSWEEGTEAFRDKGGEHEVDLIAEGPGGNVVAIEVKAAGAPSKRHARNLLWLRERLGNRFLAGAVMHTGPLPFQLDERIFALRIDRSKNSLMAIGTVDRSDSASVRCAARALIGTESGGSVPLS